ncbi:hypothetical protein AMTR_s00019p00146540 [Amborella trichopoda]|uniref:Uncharacterized protein n=1 Tax=Amborella trichopoda TaxID=13333 RepID=W1PJA6_AMBTC|nr:hypothetical protein AMTR_s00019p00146540 [Amborella trichopoda]
MFFRPLGSVFLTASPLRILPTPRVSHRLTCFASFRLLAFPSSHPSDSLSVSLPSPLRIIPAPRLPLFASFRLLAFPSSHHSDSSPFPLRILPTPRVSPRLPLPPSPTSSFLFPSVPSIGQLPKILGIKFHPQTISKTNSYLKQRISKIISQIT